LADHVMQKILKEGLFTPKGRTPAALRAYPRFCWLGSQSAR